MRYSEIIAETITYREQMRGYHSGQSDVTVYALDGDTIAGRIDFSTFDGDVAVQMIEVDPAYRRRGIGRGLLRRLQAQFPDTEIDLGMLTADGQGLVDAMPVNKVPDEKVIADQQRLAAVQKTLADLEALSDRVYAGDASDEERDRLQASLDIWNDLHDEEYELEDALRGRKTHRRIFVR